jgi:hypothetical protein
MRTHPMRNLLLMVVLILGILIQPARMQANPNWENGCDPAIVALIEPVEGVFDYSAACEGYHACAIDAGYMAVCQLQTLHSLQAVCPADDTHCRQSAVLYAAAIGAFEISDPYAGVGYTRPTEAMMEFYPQALTLYQTGDTAGALEAFGNIPDEDYSFAPMLELSRGLLKAELGDTAGALDHYQQIEDYNPHNALMRYVRAQLYGTTGNPVLASFDAEWLRQYTQNYPEAAVLIASLTAAYPLDTSRLQTWRAYPILQWGDGSGGPSARFVTRDEPFNVRLAFYDEADMQRVLALGVSLTPETDESPFANVDVLAPEADAGDAYQVFYFIPNWHESSFKASLTVLEDDLLVLDQTLWLFEGGGGTQSLLVPVDAPDPRAMLRTTTCAAPSRLRVGMTARNRPYDENWEQVDELYDAPFGTARFYGGEVTIIGGGECSGVIYWWEVRTEDGDTGWMQENSDTAYRLHPYPPALYICPGSLPPRLAEEQNARVVTGLGANNLRNAPGTDAEQIGQLPEAAEVEVLAGPVCDAGLSWWQVRSGELEGWTAEGQAEQYWLEPVLKEN